MEEKARVPTCIGIILDGNRRWAKQHGLPALEGHRHGLDNLETIVRVARDKGIRHVVVYAFSTENWNRPSEEVSYLMRLFESAIRERFNEFLKDNIAIRFVGQRERLPSALQTLMRDVEKKNPAPPDLTLWICVSYGGRAEIVEAAQAAAKEGGVTEASLQAHLWTAGMPDPDLIIRTSGEKRLSNFLLWQSAYSELFFVDHYWPAFTPDDLDSVLKEYAARERRLGS